MCIYKRLIVLLLLIVSTSFASQSYFVKDEFVNVEYLHTKTQELGSELFDKSGVSLYLLAIKTTNGKALIEYEMEFSKQLQAPFILLSISLEEKKVDILASPEVEKSFDKKQVLSPYPWSGTIVPVLTSKIKGDPSDKYAAALLNGYADIADQVADYYKIELASSIGNANKNVINIFRMIFYTMLFISIGYYLYRRFKKDV